MQQKLDLSTGSSMKKILLFSFPLIGSSIFQQLYNFIDTLIVSHFLGIEAVAAVGTYYPLNFLILGFVQGSCIGFSIPLSQDIGRKEYKEVKCDLLAGIVVCFLLSIILTVVMIINTNSLLIMLHTPPKIFNLTIIFTLISFAGIPANILYNYSASVLRAFGNSKQPFYFLVISLIINIFLDLLFILVFNLGIKSIALATVISEFIAGMMNAIYYVKQKQFVKVTLSTKFFNKKKILKICFIGFPMGFEYSISAIGAIIMQYAINLLGTSAIAAQAAAEKIRQLLTLPMESVGTAMATYTAQNYGASQIDRIKQGVRNGTIIQFIWSLFSLLLVCLFKNSLITLMLGVTSKQVFSLTDLYLTTISYFFIIHGMLMIFRNTIQGLGHSIYAMASGVGELIGRASASYLSILSWGYTAICYANQIAWGISLIICSFILVIIIRKDPAFSPID